MGRRPCAPMQSTISEKNIYGLIMKKSETCEMLMDGKKKDT